MQILALERKLRLVEKNPDHLQEDAVLEAYRRYRAHGERGEYNGIIVTGRLVAKAKSRARTRLRAAMEVPRQSFV